MNRIIIITLSCLLFIMKSYAMEQQMPPLTIGNSPEEVETVLKSPLLVGLHFRYYVSSLYGIAKGVLESSIEPKLLTTLERTFFEIYMLDYIEHLLIKRNIDSVEKTYIKMQIFIEKRMGDLETWKQLHDQEKIGNRLYIQQVNTLLKLNDFAAAVRIHILNEQEEKRLKKSLRAAL